MPIKEIFMLSKKIIDLSIVIPVYNERESLRELVRQIEISTTLSHEYIFIDDGSTDGSFDELIKIKKSINSRFKIIKFRKNLGKSAAMSVGFDKAEGRKVITLDADLQDDPTEFTKLLDKLDEGFDVVVGWRKNRQDPKKKIQGSHLFNWVVSKIGGLNLHDINCGLKAFKKEVVKEIDIYGELHRFIPLLAKQRGFNVTEVPVIHHKRKFGSSKFGSYRILHALLDLITTDFISGFKNRPLQIFGVTGGTLIFFATIILLYLSYLKLLGESIGGRPLLLMGILLFLSGVQVFSTGLIGELIANTQVQKNNYPIEKIIE